ncbi:Family of uncharacterised function (DUF1028) [Raoultella ornithinolytica]|nr:Family of uncharacterised function (DUF1028) [Raoultella ornithinolytica]
MTFSIAAYCPESGQFGIALSSSSIAVGARCPWLQAGVGGGIQSEHHVTGAGSAGVSATGTGIRAGHRVAQGAGGGRF